MLPRILRVVRAKAVRKTALASQASRADSKNLKNPNKAQIYNPKMSSEISSLQGRAAKLLGRAGAAKFRKSGGSGGSGANGTAMGMRGQRQNGVGSGIEGIKRTPESIVFEGHRATSKAGKPRDLKMGGGGGGRKKGKPRTRSSKRGTEWKKGGGKKGK
jgi:nucleolar protein 12